MLAIPSSWEVISLCAVWSWRLVLTPYFPWSLCSFLSIMRSSRKLELRSLWFQYSSKLIKDCLIGRREYCSFVAYIPLIFSAMFIKICSLCASSSKRLLDFEKCLVWRSEVWLISYPLNFIPNLMEEHRNGFLDPSWPANILYTLYRMEHGT
jgi:hypothetical protein